MLATKGEPVMLHQQEILHDTFHSLPVDYSWILNELCKYVRRLCRIWSAYCGWPQNTTNHLCKWHSPHTHLLRRRRWALVDAKLGSGFHRSGYQLRVGESKLRCHSLNVCLLID